MDTLRIILIAGGVALLVGIYLWDRLQARRRQEAEPWPEGEVEGMEEDGIDPRSQQQNPFDDDWEVVAIPARRESENIDEALDGLEGISTASEEADAEQVAPSAGASHDEPHDEEVIILSLMAAEGGSYNGMQLLDAMEVCGLQHGDMGIFHYDDLDSGKPLFSVANVLEPGNFDLDSMGELETPGLALFMRLPAPLDGEKALLTFVQQARLLQGQLSGVLTDAKRRELSRETLEELQQTARRFPVDGK
jgi:cell division protein ZipA